MSAYLCPSPAGPSVPGPIHSLTRRAVAGLLLGAMLLVTAAQPALALEPPNLADQVTDQAGVLDRGEEADVEAALQALRDEQNIQLFVAYVDTTDGMPAADFAEATAAASSLGGNDALLLVAIDDRSDAMWVGPLLDSVTDTEIDTILAEVVEPLLADGAFADAMIAGADALGAAAASAVVTPTAAPNATPNAGATTAPSGGGSGSGSGGGIPILPILAVIVIGGGILLVVRSQMQKRKHAQAQAATTADLGRDANRLLLETDEALKDAANDVEFASAQWGEPEVKPYREAIARADAELRAAFSIRQKLDDAEPESPAEREQLLREIVARAGGAKQLLDDQEERFDQLGDLVATAPAQLDALPASIETLRARLSKTASTADRLRATYAATATASVDGNAEEAAKALDTAAAEAERGKGIVVSKPNDGVIALRTAQEALAAATALLDAVERLATSLDDAAGRLPAELDAAARDVASARAAVDQAARDGTATSGPPAAPGQAAIPSTAALADALRAAEVALGDARRSAEARPLDPLAAVQKAMAANQAADGVVAAVQSAQQLRQRRVQNAQAAVANAQGHVTRAVDFITTRRHGVGGTARTRAAEAQLRLEEAQARLGADPEAATALAVRATQLADEAYNLAAGEFDQWQGGGQPAAGTPGQDIVGGILGGVIGGTMSGGGRPPAGSGWGGSPWGGPSSGQSRGGFGGRPTTSGGGRIGGAGRSGGGGGGGRARGGRW